MNLSYRGIAYQPVSFDVEVTETAETGHFLGKTYKILQTNVAPRQQTTPMRYRGINYNL